MIRELTAQDITDFYTSRTDLLALDESGAFVHLDRGDVEGRAVSGAVIKTTQGEEIEILLTREGITDGDWFPDALDESGDLIESEAAEMAWIINGDAGLTVAAAVAQVHALGEQAEADAQQAQESAMRRAQAVAHVVELSGGNQSQAARRLGLDQSTVNKLVRKAAATDVEH